MKLTLLTHSTHERVRILNAPAHEDVCDNNFSKLIIFKPRNRKSSDEYLETLSFA